MKKTVIAIWGESNQGKSSSIRTIVDLVPTLFRGADVDVRIGGGDVQVIITIGEIKIGVESQGDPGGRLHRSLDLFVEEECDVIICSTRTRGSTVQSVEALNTENGYDIMWTSNYFCREKSIDDSNQYFAEHILFVVGLIMAGRY